MNEIFTVRLVHAVIRKQACGKQTLNESKDCLFDSRLVVVAAIVDVGKGIHQIVGDALCLMSCRGLDAKEAAVGGSGSRHAVGEERAVLPDQGSGVCAKGDPSIGSCYFIPLSFV